MPPSPRSTARPLGATTAVLALTVAFVGGGAVAAQADELTVGDYAGLVTALDPAAPLVAPRTVVLGADIVATASGVLVVTADAPITLDLAGHALDLDGAADTLTGSIALEAGADLTITDTTATPGTLTAVGADRSAGIRTTGASLTIDGSAIVQARGGGQSIGANDDGTGAGIGGDGDHDAGGGGAGGAVTIGGTAVVTATGGGIVTGFGGNNYGGTGAGIGGGGSGDAYGASPPGGDGGVVVIGDRARVTAVGGDIAAGMDPYAGAGAGIGGGGGSLQPGAGNSVVIEGAAQVSALGGSVHGSRDVGGGGAAIGSGGGTYQNAAAVSGGTASVFVLAALTSTAGTGYGASAGAPAVVTQTLPEITAVSPAAGRPGDALTIAGSGLAFATAVTVGGVAAPFSVVDDGELHATVPTGSGTGLPVAVTIAAPGGTPSYTVTLPNSFGYAPPPAATPVLAATGAEPPLAAGVLALALLTVGAVVGLGTRARRRAGRIV